MLRVVVLVVGFGLVEGHSGLHLSYDLAIAIFFSVLKLLEVLSSLLRLFVINGEDGRAVLRADVRPLTVALARIETRFGS